MSQKNLASVGRIFTVPPAPCHRDLIATTLRNAGYKGEQIAPLLRWMRKQGSSAKFLLHREVRQVPNAREVGDIFQFTTRQDGVVVINATAMPPARTVTIPSLGLRTRSPGGEFAPA